MLQVLLRASQVCIWVGDAVLEVDDWDRPHYVSSAIAFAHLPQAIGLATSQLP